MHNEMFQNIYGFLSTKYEQKNSDILNFEDLNHTMDQKLSKTMIFICGKLRNCGKSVM